MMASYNTGSTDYNSTNCIFISTSDLYLNSHEQYENHQKLEKEIIEFIHKVERRLQQKIWWFEALRERIKLYNCCLINNILYRRILRCNRRGIGLRIKINK